MLKSKVTLSLRPRRIFSTEFKKKLVADIEQKKITIRGVTREYSVSYQAVYTWLHKYSSSLSSFKPLVMQMESEQHKTGELQQRVLELEAALGRKQMEVDYLSKLIDIAGKDLGMDLKKNTKMPPSDGIGKTSNK